MLVAKWIAARLLALLAVALFSAAVGGGCYAGRDCKPGDACWTNCATDPSGPGCAEPWQPVPIGAKNPDAGADR